MSSSNCCFVTCIQISQEAGQVVWYSHLFQNFPVYCDPHNRKIIVKLDTYKLHINIGNIIFCSCFFFFRIKGKIEVLLNVTSGSWKEWMQHTSEIQLSQDSLYTLPTWSPPVSNPTLSDPLPLNVLIFSLSLLCTRKSHLSTPNFCLSLSGAKHVKTWAFIPSRINWELVTSFCR